MPASRNGSRRRAPSRIFAFLTAALADPSQLPHDGDFTEERRLDGDRMVARQVLGLPDIEQRNEIATRLQRSCRDIIELRHDQVEKFAGNALELQGSSGRILAMSTTALASLDDQRRQMIEERVKIVALDIPTIKMAGGFVRCTLAGVHLLMR